MDNTGRLGLVKLLSESSIGSGVRRVEALVGTDAYNFLAREHVLVAQLAEVVKARPEELVERVGGIMTKLRDAEKEIGALKAGRLLQIAGSLADGATDVHGVAVVTHQAPDGASADDLRKLVLDVRGRLGTRPAVVAVAAAAGERPVVVIATNDGSRGLGLEGGRAGALGGQDARRRRRRQGRRRAGRRHRRHRDRGGAGGRRPRGRREGARVRHTEHIERSSARGPDPGPGPCSRAPTSGTGVTR